MTYLFQVGPSFTRSVTVVPGWDRRSDQPGQDYGVHDCRLWFSLRGRRGAIVFQVGTGWYPESVLAWWESRTDLTSTPMRIVTDYGDGPISAHSAGKIKGEIGNPKCEWLGGRTCWNVGNWYLEGQRVGMILREQGSEAMWAELETFYRTAFK